MVLSHKKVSIFARQGLEINEQKKAKFVKHIAQHERIDVRTLPPASSGGASVERVCVFAREKAIVFAM